MIQSWKMIERLYFYFMIILCLIGYQYEIRSCFNIAIGICFAMIIWEINIIIKVAKEIREREKQLKELDERMNKILEGNKYPFQTENPDASE
jgi:hypothetical protein